MKSQLMPRLVLQPRKSIFVGICLSFALSAGVVLADNQGTGNNGNNSGNSRPSEDVPEGLVDGNGDPLTSGLPDDRPSSEILVMPWEANADEIAAIKALDDGKLFDGMKPQEKLELARRFLEHRVIGQKELVKVMLEIERTLLVEGLGMREVPEIVYMMGLPGTGKDTMAKAYTDMRTRPGGHKEHMFYLPVARTTADMWKAFGSNTGYKGSDKISPLIRWLVTHSGGRYTIENKGDSEAVVETEGWYPTKNPPAGAERPENAVLYVDEFHNWSQEAKDGFLKQGLEKGYWPINNPGSGLAEIYVPVTIMIASNEGIGLVATRDAQGNRVGPPMKFEDLHRKWKRVHSDKVKLKKAIKQHGVGKDHTQQVNTGISEELLNRMPDSHIVLLEPLSPTELSLIAEMKLVEYQTTLEFAEGDFGPVDLAWKNGVLEFVTGYQLDAEGGGRYIANKIEVMIEQTIRDIIFSCREFSPGNRSQKIIFGVEENTDQTYSMTYDIFVNERKVKKGSFPIEYTRYHKPAEPIAPEQLEKLRQLPKEINKRVFNLEHVAERLGRSLMVGEERAIADTAGDTTGLPARTFMFLGLSSTGKTETAKVAVDVIGKVTGIEGDALKTFDFSQIQSEAQLRDMILGKKNPANGQVEASPFMQHYDKYDGKAFYVFDEVANTPRHVLRVLYDILREPVVTTFADGEPRKMSNVTIFMTGNAGEEWFLEIPRDIPKDELRRAMTSVYIEAMSDPGYRRRFLEQFFSPALLNRIGLQNIYFFPPHTFKSTRQLSLMKLGQALESLRPTQSGLGWRVGFISEADYLATVGAIEQDGFDVNEQGASIDRYTKQDFAEALRAELLMHDVASGSDVVLAYAGKLPGKKLTPPRHYFTCYVPAEDRAFEFWLDGVPQNKAEKISETEDILTAYHEAAHSLVRSVLLGDKWEQVRISIIPGVGKFGDHWLRYLGVAESERFEYVPPTRLAVVQSMAVLLAGEQAEYLVSGRYSGGKANDIERATSMAYQAILKSGLSEAWGNESPPSDVSLFEFLRSLPDERRRLLGHEVEKLMLESRALARETLLANFKSALEPLAVLLAEKGDLDRQALQDFYDQVHLRKPEERTRMERMWYGVQDLLWRVTTGRRQRHQRRTIKPHVAKPETVASIEKLIAAMRDKEIAEVELPEDLPVAGQEVQLDEKLLAQHQERVREIEERRQEDLRRRPGAVSACPGAFHGD